SCQIIYDASSKSDGKPSQLTSLGWLGELHPKFRDNLGLRQPAFIFELSLDELKVLQQNPLFTEVPGTPVVLRDLTVDIGEHVEHTAVQSCIQSGGGAVLRQTELTKIYELDPGKTKSLTFRLQFQSPERTLTNDEVETSLAKIRKAL